MTPVLHVRIRRDARLEWGRYTNEQRVTVDEQAEEQGQ